MAVGRDMKGKKNSVIAVIGDGAITGGMAYEAMNHAGFLDKNMIVILNDNQQVRDCKYLNSVGPMLGCEQPAYLHWHVPFGLSSIAPHLTHASAVIIWCYIQRH